MTQIWPKYDSLRRGPQSHKGDNHNLHTIGHCTAAATISASHLTNQPANQHGGENSLTRQTVGGMKGRPLPNDHVKFLVKLSKNNSNNDKERAIPTTKNVRHDGLN